VSAQGNGGKKAERTQRPRQSIEGYTGKKIEKKPTVPKPTAKAPEITKEASQDGSTGTKEDGSATESEERDANIGEAIATIGAGVLFTNEGNEASSSWQE
jgi:hypothetical protein